MAGRTLSWFEREISEQPEALRRTLEACEAPLRRWWNTSRARPTLMVLVGRGSSYHASLYAQYLIQCEFQLPAMIAQPAVDLWYRRSWPKNKTWVIGLSQSGETPDVVEFLDMARHGGAYTVGITNHGDSPLAGAVHEAWVTAAGPERAIPTSKTYTAQLAVLALWAAMGNRRKLWRAQLDRLPTWTDQTLKHTTSSLRSGVGPSLTRGCLVVGRGYQHGAALETALKLREVGRILAAGMSATEFLHTSVALSARRLPLVVHEARGVLSRHLRHVELVCRKHRLPSLWLANGRKRTGARLSYPVGVPEWLSPIPSAVLGQLLAAAWGRRGGWNLDGGPEFPKVTKIR